MASAPRLTDEERALLEQVRAGKLDNRVSVPTAINALLERGVVERAIVLTLPVLPTRYRYRLTDLGRQLLAED